METVEPKAALRHLTNSQPVAGQNTVRSESVMTADGFADDIREIRHREQVARDLRQQQEFEAMQRALKD